MRRVTGWLLLVAGVAAMAAEPARAAAVVPLGYSTDASITDGTFTPAGFANAVAAGGGTLARVQIDWPLVQPRNASIAPSAWARSDARIAALRHAGVRPLLLFLASPGWARDLGGDVTCGISDYCQSPPADDHVADWAAFVAAAAARYPEAAGLEIWNEENAQFFWHTGPDPARYTRLVCATRAAVRSAGATAPVIAGGLDGGDKLTTQSSADFLGAAYDAGIGSCIDAVGVHPYPGLIAPGAPGSGFPSEVNRIRAVMRAHGDAVHRIWITEIGVPTAGPDALTAVQQSAYLVAAYRAAQTLGVESFIVHTLIDSDASGADLGPYGVLGADGTAKPAYAALRDVARLLDGKTAKPVKRRVVRHGRRRGLLGIKRPLSSRFPGVGAVLDATAQAPPATSATSAASLPRHARRSQCIACARISSGS